MTVKISVKADIRGFERQMTTLQKKQLPFATARAVTAVAKLAVKDIQSEMKSVFRDPTPFTLNAFYAKPAKRGDPTAFVGSREWAAKGRPAFKYLAPEIFGGPRNMKGFELLLSRLSGGQFAVPTSASATLSRGEITRILSRLNSLRDPAQNVTAKTTAALRRKKLLTQASGNVSEYFVAHEGGLKSGRPTGIYRLVGKGQVEKVIGFVQNAPAYTIRLPVEKIIKESVAQNFKGEFRKALMAALATAR